MVYIYIYMYIINRGHVFTKTNQHVKYESFVINKFQDNKQKPWLFFTQVTLTFDIKNTKSIRVKPSQKQLAKHMIYESSVITELSR